jgi:hypothetical protein
VSGPESILLWLGNNRGGNDMIKEIVTGALLCITTLAIFYYIPVSMVVVGVILLCGFFWMIGNDILGT